MVFGSRWDKERGAVEFRTDKSHHTFISQKVRRELQSVTPTQQYPVFPEVAEVEFKECAGYEAVVIEVTEAQ